MMHDMSKNASQKMAQYALSLFRWCNEFRKKKKKMRTVQVQFNLMKSWHEPYIKVRFT